MALLYIGGPLRGPFPIFSKHPEFGEFTLFKINFLIQGDSGGPLSIDGTVYGLTSFGSSKCAAGHPSAFTRVSEFREWIRNHSGI